MLSYQRALLAGLLAAGMVCAGESFTFIQMSDPQFGSYTKNEGFAHETVKFDFAIATANRLKPGFVIVTRDLINKPGDAAQAAEYKRTAAKPDRP